MKNHALALGLAAALLATTACNKHNGNGNATGPEPAQTPKAQKAAGSKTIAAGLAPTSRFMTIAKAAGLDQTLAGPGPYTVFVPDDAAFGSAPAGTFVFSPQNRPQLTTIVTSQVLPGTVIVVVFGCVFVGSFDISPQNRPQLTVFVTSLVLPGTVMVADIDKAIDNGKG